MAKKIDMTGRRFGRWSVLAKGAGKKWLCVCECGIERAVAGHTLRAGTSVSCGCYRDEQTRLRETRHGMSGTRFFLNWVAMKERCQMATSTHWANYGGRGITVCERWQTFENFLSDMFPTYVEGLSIEREDNNGNYELGNCRWATAAEQAANRRSTVFVTTPKGQMPLRVAARTYGISAFALARRIANGWPPDRLLEPANSGPRCKPGEAPDASTRDRSSEYQKR